MEHYGTTGQKPVSARRNLTTVGVLIAVGMAALALTHVTVTRPPLSPLRSLTLHFLCPLVQLIVRIGQCAVIISIKYAQ